MIATLYPSKIEQPNQNQSSGLAGKCLKEIRRDKSVHPGNCRNQKDPKYHHAWSNTSELKTGGVTQCGRRSSYHCSHSTYYGIKGYRNTCPIAGVNGTYTQPATLRLHFDPLSKGISSVSQIKKVKLNISHRCTGVDVANDKEYDSWGPNFSGFNTYASRNVLTVKFAGQKLVYNKNPPLSKSKFDTITLEFENVSYSDLKKGYVDIIYGNNLSSNPGNIYLKGVSLEVDYQDGTPYLEGKQSTDQVYISPTSGCRNRIKFTLKAGYQTGSKKIAPSKAPRILQKLGIKSIKIPDGFKIINIDQTNSDKRTIVITGEDQSNMEGIKEIIFGLKGMSLKKSFKYEAKRRLKPEIIVPDTIEKNTMGSGKDGIVVRDGCATKLTVYDGGVTGSNITITGLDPTNQNNLLTKQGIINLYNWISQLDCGFHTLFFRRDNEADSSMIQKEVKIIPTRYRVYFAHRLDKEYIDYEVIHSLDLVQNKNENHEIEIVFEKTHELISDPVFEIINPTFGKEVSGIPTPDRVNKDVIRWTPSKEGGTYRLTVGRYHPGEFKINLTAPYNCSGTNKKLNVNITPNHKQYFDEIFVRGEDSTAFDYDYLVALEGDKITEPLYVESKNVGASYKDIKICTKKNKLGQLGNLTTLPISIKNTSNDEVKNLLIELNTLIKNEDDELEVTTSEWLDESGVFFNFEENFKNMNDEGINSIVSIENLKDDEENVYLKVKKLAAKESIEVNIPFGCYIEKEVYLQLLMFGTPIAIYDNDDCGDETKTFTKIFLKVYDSILTEMEITGDLDILTLSDTSCPLKCFKTEEGIKYKIRNIDTQSLEEMGKVVIRNDPRLIPYQYKLLGKDIQPIEELSSKFLYKRLIENRDYILNGEKVTFKTNFPGYESKTLFTNVNPEGLVKLYIDIPLSVGRTYTAQQLFDESKMIVKTASDDICNLRVIDDHTIYNPGDTVPLTIEVKYSEEVFVNEFSFVPNIKDPGMYDEVTIYYKVCNLKNNEGILKTSFETDSYVFVENKVEKDILFGVDTQLTLYSQLKQVVTEQGNYNRLYLTVVNKKRLNKDIKIRIGELPDLRKYQYYYANIDVGDIIEEENEIIWSIPFLEKDSTVKGYIDFEAEKVGISSLIIDKEDFLTNLNIEFDRKDCDCMREVEDD